MGQSDVSTPRDGAVVADTEAKAVVADATPLSPQRGMPVQFLSFMHAFMPICLHFAL